MTHLLITDSLHEGGLSSTVTSTDTVPPSSPELEVGVVQQQQTSVSERELDITQDLALFIVLFLDNGKLGLVDIHECLFDGFSTGSTLLGTQQQLHERTKSLGIPNGSVPSPHLDEVGNDVGLVLDGVGNDGRVGEGSGEWDGRVGWEFGHLEVRSHDGQCLDNGGVDITRGKRGSGSGSTGIVQDIKSGLGESSNLGESGTGSESLDTVDETTEVSRSDIGVSNELDQISDNDTSHSLSVG